MQKGKRILRKIDLATFGTSFEKKILIPQARRA